MVLCARWAQKGIQRTQISTPPPLWSNLNANFSQSVSVQQRTGLMSHNQAHRVPVQ